MCQHKLCCGTKILPNYDKGNSAKLVTESVYGRGQQQLQNIIK